ncbi:MAG: hypothetical protein JXR65_10980 [Bacteroidales bacterium]|nr:hypothetical protein [Bacteroidales bacterium]
MTQTWHANGKLLLTGEYLVMDGAKALAIPVNKGQSLTVETLSEDSQKIYWKAYSPEGLWFEAVFQLPEINITETSDKHTANKLKRLLLACQKGAPGFLTGSDSFQVTTVLGFPSNYGWGSSSTLVSNLAHWANIDPFVLQRNVLGGSAYDIACARNNTPVLYQLQDEKPIIRPIDFDPVFSSYIYFLHLEKKQNTEESVRHFRESSFYNKEAIQRISEIAILLTHTKELKDFENLLNEHEQLMSKILNRETVKELLFSEYPGTIKSLGAWGGDFVLVTRHGSEQEMKDYFSNKGYNTLFSWESVSLKS